MSTDVAPGKVIRSTASPQQAQLIAFPRESGLRICCPYCDSAESGLYCRGRRAVILRCCSCGGLYDPVRIGEIAAADDVAERVSQEYVRSYDDNESAELAIAHGVIKLLRDRLPAATRYLEL